MVFQPIVELSTRNTVGVEALARFRSLPLRAAERMVRRGRPARAWACSWSSPRSRRRCASWPSARGRLPGGELLAPRGHSSRAGDACWRRTPGGIVVEITEHEAVEDYDALATALAPLREIGVRIAIDDAGAGFASMRHTLQLAPDIVKMDISAHPGHRHRPREASPRGGPDLVRRGDGHGDRGRGHRDGGGARDAARRSAFASVRASTWPDRLRWATQGAFLADACDRGGGYVGR